MSVPRTEDTFWSRDCDRLLLGVVFRLSRDLVKPLARLVCYWRQRSGTRKGSQPIYQYNFVASEDITLILWANRFHFKRNSHTIDIGIDGPEINYCYSVINYRVSRANYIAGPTVNKSMSDFSDDGDYDNGPSDDRMRKCGRQKYRFINKYIGGLVHERRNSSAVAVELRLSCTNPSTCSWCN